MAETTVTTTRNPITLLKRAGQLYRRKGTQGVVRASVEYLRLHTPVLPKPRYQDRRIDNEYRWSLIEPYLAETDSLLDIGCSEGYFASRAARKGLDSTGVDVDPDRIAYARRESADNATFEVAEVAPDTVDELPQTDVVLFLTVHHHWVREYGFEAASDMIRTLCSNADRFIYEPPGDRYLGCETADVPRSPTSYYQEYLRETLGDDIRILADSTVPYTGAGRDDPFFIVDTSDYRFQPYDESTE